MTDDGERAPPAGGPSEAKAAAPASDKPARDVVFVRGPSDDGNGVSIVRLRDDKVEVGELRAAREGQPLYGELVRLEQRPEHERLYDVEVLAEAPKAKPSSSLPAARKGPAKVSSEAFRDGWDQIFGDKSKNLLN